MEREFDYEELFTQAIDKIKSVRDPRATRGDLSDPRWGCLLYTSDAADD